MDNKTIIKLIIRFMDFKTLLKFRICSKTIKDIIYHNMFSFSKSYSEDCNNGKFKIKCVDHGLGLIKSFKHAKLIVEHALLFDDNKIKQLRNNLISFSFWLTHSPITNSGIKNLINLMSLNMEFNQNIDDNGIKHLINLKELYIFKTNITNDGIKSLYNLEILSLNDNITDEGVKNLKKLEVLEIYQNHKISKNMLNKLAKNGTLIFKKCIILK